MFKPTVLILGSNYFQGSRNIVDSIDEHELFDGMGYFPDGLPKIYGETGEVLAGLKKGRESKDELIVTDMVVAREIFNRAVERGTGRKLLL